MDMNKLLTGCLLICVQRPSNGLVNHLGNELFYRSIWNGHNGIKEGEENCKPNTLKRNGVNKYSRVGNKVDNEKIQLLCLTSYHCWLTSS